ncbi:MAG: nucleotidyltransferase domain-containing protein [Sulfolobales archaeon]
MECVSIDELVRGFERALVESFLSVFGDRLVSLVLYGSYARGDFRGDSDVDLIVVLNDVIDRYALHLELDRVEELLAPILRCFKKYGYNPVLSPIVLGIDQARDIRPLYLDAVFDVKILYDRGSFMSNIFERLRRKLEEYGARRVRIGRKWVTVLKNSYRFGEVIEFE